MEDDLKKIEDNLNKIEDDLKIIRQPKKTKMEDEPISHNQHNQCDQQGNMQYPPSLDFNQIPL
jgi:hypothetical protein